MGAAGFKDSGVGDLFNMSTQLIVIIGLGVVALIVGLLLLVPLGKSSMSNLRGNNTRGGMSDEDLTIQEREFRRAKELLAKKAKKKREVLTLEDRFFQAGLFTRKDQQKYYNIKRYAPFIGALALAYGGYLVDNTFMWVGAVFGLLVGIQFPTSWLDRQILKRGEDIMFYLPLVIEQISIGVSSSLDIGPVLQRVVSMADERDSHNVVTDMLRVVVTLAKSGISLEDALNDVGKKSGHLELKQTFAALAQVTRHGGEITKQLQELADAVASQRETRIEAKIKKLELEATGPVALVFMGFFTILLTCIGMQMIKAFG